MLVRRRLKKSSKSRQLFRNPADNSNRALGVILAGGMAGLVGIQEPYTVSISLDGVKVELRKDGTWRVGHVVLTKGRHRLVVESLVAPPHQPAKIMWQTGSRLTFESGARTVTDVLIAHQTKTYYIVLH